MRAFTRVVGAPLLQRREETKKITKTLNPHVLFRCVKIFLKREYKLIINTKRVTMCKFRTPDDDDDDVVDKNESTV